ncbi:MAG: ABC transporter permease [Acidobacteriia bacterium]|nr:ABC transporter permease [Terriglobia bacterium]
MNAFIRKLVWLLHSSDKEAELRAELQFHLEEDAEQRQMDGLAPQEARLRALRNFGNVTLIAEDTRAVWVPVWLDQIFQELCYGLRTLRRDWAFTLAAIATLTLAIALNVTVFTVMDAILFRGAPLVKGSDRLLFIQERDPSGRCCVSYPDFEDWRSQAHAFQRMAFIADGLVVLRERQERPTDTFAFNVSTNLFRLLGVRPILGRDFVPSDEAPGAAPVAILNYRFWESRFRKRADIAGLAVQINGAPASIIGVMPDGLDFPTQGDMWVPIAHTPALLKRGLTPGSFEVVGRLRDDADLPEARTELATINRRLEADYPVTNRNLLANLFTYSAAIAGENAPRIFGSLWAGACLVLLIACANLANLSLARTISRSREFATRIALGAGRGRMVLQILSESILLAGAGGALGWWMAKWAVRTWAVATFSPYQVVDYSVNSGTLAYLAATSAVVAILVSLPPISRIVRMSLSGALRGDCRGVTEGPRGTRLARVLVVGQMAFAIVLLSGAGVLVRSFVAIVSAKTGVRDPEHVLVGSLRLPSDKYSAAEARRAYFNRLEEQLRTIPGIEREAVASTLPVSFVNLRSFEIEGRPGEQDLGFLSVGPDYFLAVGAAPAIGRGFDDRDRPAALPVAVVNESFAATFWPGEQPLGKRIRAMEQGKPGEWRVVVGVVSNIMQGDALRQRFKPLVYVPLHQEPPGRRAYLLVRAPVSQDQLARPVRAKVQKLDPDVLLGDLTTLKAHFAFDRDSMDAEHSELGKQAAVSPVFALIALLLAVVGLYAVIAQSVSQRTKEIGIRMAIGAAAEDIRKMVLRDGMLPAAIGLILGLAGSLAVNRILQSQLVSVSPYDPVTMTGAPVILISVALFACLVPARRAMNVDPAVALRHE